MPAMDYLDAASKLWIKYRYEFKHNGKYSQFDAESYIKAYEKMP